MIFSRGAATYAVHGAIALLVTIGCADEFDSARVVPERGTLGEEIYKVVCQRMASEELPADVSGAQTRDLCAGDAAADAAPTPRLRALAEQRSRLVAALDQMLPESMEDDLDTFMLQLIPFYDPPTEQLPEQTRALADVFTRILNDADAVDALERMSQRAGYRPLRVALGVARPMMAYPRLPEFTSRALDTIAADGSAGAEWEAMLQAAALEMATMAPDSVETFPTTLDLSRELLFSGADAFGSGGARFLAIRDRRGLAVPISSSGALPTPFVDRDADGSADIDVFGRFVDGSGGLLVVPAPFAVLDELGVSRDPAGRATGTDGTPLFTYLDVNETFLAGVTREAEPWFDPADPIMLDMVFGMPALLGPEVTREERFGGTTVSYTAYDTDQSPLVHVLHALGTMLDRPETSDAMALTERLLLDHDAEVAALIDAGLLGDAVGDVTPSAALVPGDALWDDMILVTERITQEPGLMEALLRALADPRSKRLGQIYAEMMRHRDPVGFDPSDINRVMSDQMWSQEVDRAEPDVAGNLSLFQQSLSIIHDLNGVSLCNKEGASLTISVFGFDFDIPFISFGECDLLEINDVAQTFALSIIGRAEIELKSALLAQLLRIGGIVGLGADELLEQQSGIDGLTTRPTPQSLARLVFAPRPRFLTNLIDPPVTIDGVPVEERHEPIIFAWERTFRFCGDELVAPGAPCADPEEVTFYDAMSPLLEAFDDFDRRTEGRFLFSELIRAIHLHLPSPDSDMTQSSDPSGRFFAHQGDAISYEPILADLFADCTWDSTTPSRRCRPEQAGQLIGAVHRLGLALEAIEVRPGVDGVAVMAAATEQMMDPARNAGDPAMGIPPLTDRDGGRTTLTNDGARTPDVTPMYLLLDALNGMDAGFEAAAPERHTRWLSARSGLVDQMLDTTRSGGAARFDNRRTLAALRILTPFIADRIAAHRAAGDLDAWADTLDDRLAGSLGSAMGSSAMRFVDAVQADPEAREELSLLIGYLVAEASGNDAFNTTLLSAADLLQILEDDANIVPLLNVLADGIAPDTRVAVATGGAISTDGSALDQTLDLLREINFVDDRETLTRVLANMVALPDSGAAETPLETLLDVIAEVNRAAPGEGGPLRADDHRAVFGSSVDFLTDEDRGLERIYDVIQNREIVR